MRYGGGMAAEEIRIETCPAHLRADALRMLHAGLSADQQEALPAALDAERNQGADAFAGLLVATIENAISGALWVQLAAGCTAVVWPAQPGGAASAELMQAAADFLDERRIPLAQILISPDAPQDAELYRQGGLEHLVDLTYLALDGTFYPEPVADDTLEFLPAASEEPERLGKLLLATYEQTLDCPEINGLRGADDILASYAVQGNFAPERWFFVRHREEDVGALLLTEYQPSGTWELIYMGVLPQQRGRGFGRRILRFALAQAKQAGAPRLVLAADVRNQPALDMYRAAGLTAFDSRRVYARLRATAQS